MADFCTYVVANQDRTMLYVNMTNDLRTRLIQHGEERGNPKTFAGGYYCHRLVYYEIYETAYEAIQREKALIATLNPHWRFLE